MTNQNPTPHQQIEAEARKAATLMETIVLKVDVYGNFRKVGENRAADYTREELHVLLDAMLDNVDGALVLSKKYGFIK